MPTVAGHLPLFSARNQGDTAFHPRPAVIVAGSLATGRRQKNQSDVATAGPISPAGRCGPATLGFVASDEPVLTDRGPLPGPYLRPGPMTLEIASAKVAAMAAAARDLGGRA